MFSFLYFEVNLWTGAIMSGQCNPGIYAPVFLNTRTH